MFLLNEYSRNILHHVRLQTVASLVRGQTKTAKMNEKFNADADKNECSSKFLLLINYGPLEGRHSSIYSKHFKHPPIQF